MKGSKSYPTLSSGEEVREPDDCLVGSLLFLNEDRSWCMRMLVIMEWAIAIKTLVPVLLHNHIPRLPIHSLMPSPEREGLGIRLVF